MLGAARFLAKLKHFPRNGNSLGISARSVQLLGPLNELKRLGLGDIRRRRLRTNQCKTDCEKADRYENAHF